MLGIPVGSEVGVEDVGKGEEDAKLGGWARDAERGREDLVA